MKKVFIFVVTLLFLLSSFYWLTQETQREEPEPLNPHKQNYQVALEEAVIEFDVYRFPLSKIQASLYHSNEPTSFLEWQELLDDSILLNGGYFLEDYSPAGGLSLLGEQQSERLFDLDKSGLVYVKDGRVSLIDTATENDLSKYISPDASYLQAYPFLIKNGEPAIEDDSELLARRTVIATTKNDVLIIIVDRTPVSLHELMLMLLDQDLGIEMALNLDGGPSTAFLYRYDGRQEASLPISGLPQILGLKLLP